MSSVLFSSISFSVIQDESDEPELDGVAVALLTVISDHDTSPDHYHPVRISVVIESDAVVSLPRLGEAFLGNLWTDLCTTPQLSQCTDQHF